MYSFVPVSTNPSLPCAPYVVAQAPVQTNPMVYSPHQALQNTGCGTVYMSSQPSQVGAVPVSLWNHPVNNIGQGTVQPQPYMQQMIAPHLSSNYPATQQQQVQYVQLVPASNASQQTFMIVPPNQSFPLNQFIDQSYQQHDALANKTLHASFARVSDPNAQNTLNLDSKNLLSSSAPADEQPSHPAQHHANGTGNVSKKVIRPPSTTWGVMLLDPVNKVNPILNVHFDFISPTEATQSYQEDANNGAANYRMHHKVCPRFTGETTHGNGCSMGQHCRYMHIHPTFLSATRSLTQPLCCAEHNCYFTRYALQTAEKMIQQAKKESEETTSMILPSTVITVWSRGICVGTIQPSKLSLTMACRRLETFPHIDLDRAACRLYQQGRCRWGKECAHVHLCRELYAQWVNSKVLHPAMHALPPLVQIEAHAEKEICKQGNFDDIASELIMSSCTPVTITPRRSPLSGLLEINEVTADRVAPTHPLLEELTAAAHSDTRTAPDNVIENQTWKTPSDDNTETHVKNDALSNLSSALFSSSHAAQMECDDHLSETDAHSRLISSFSAFCT